MKEEDHGELELRDKISRYPAVWNWRKKDLKKMRDQKNILGGKKKITLIKHLNIVEKIRDGFSS